MTNRESQGLIACFGLIVTGLWLLYLICHAVWNWIF